MSIKPPYDKALEEYWKKLKKDNIYPTPADKDLEDLTKKAKEKKNEINLTAQQKQKNKERERMSTQVLDKDGNPHSRYQKD